MSCSDCLECLGAHSGQFRLNHFWIGGHLEVLGSLLAQRLELGEHLAKTHDGLLQGRTSDTRWPLPAVRLTAASGAARPEGRRCAVLRVIAVTTAPPRDRWRRCRAAASGKSTREGCRIAHDTILSIVRSFVKPMNERQNERSK
jgi:hypothetical protein